MLLGSFVLKPGTYELPQALREKAEKTTLFGRFSIKPKVLLWSTKQTFLWRGGWRNEFLGHSRSFSELFLQNYN